MKTADACFKQSLFAILLCAAFVASVPTQVSGEPAEYCELLLNGCPKDYNAKEFTVPLSVVSLFSNFKTDCDIGGSNVTFGTNGAPAIMFLIDHTNSMTSNKIDGGGGSGSDPKGNRFRITSELVKTIYNSYHEAKVGVAVFGAGLVLNTGWDKNLVRFDGVTFSGTQEAYLPIKPLSTPVEKNGYAALSSNNDNPTWLNTIQGMFNVPAKTADTSILRRGDDGSKVPETNSTNISIAFEAAQKAFAALDTLSTPKRNRYIILLSDGEPELYISGTMAGADCGKDPDLYAHMNPRCAMQYNFTAGKIDGKPVPTTFTIFLKTPGVSVTTPNLNLMTKNIQNNGYSESNSLSKLWLSTSDYQALTRLIEENIVKPILTQSSGVAKSIVISSGGVKDSAGVVNGTITFSKLLPLESTEISKVAVGVRYDIRIDTTATTADGRDTTYAVRTVSDSLFNYDFTIRRSANAPSNWAERQNLDAECKVSKPTLELRYKDTVLSKDRPVKGNMEILQIVFGNTGDMFDQTDNVVIQVRNSDSEVSDVENFTLHKTSDGTWTYQFPREVSRPAVHGDGKLQHNEPQDSIIIIFRNPAIPLDTIRVSVPYVSNELVFYDTPGDPEDGNRLASEIEVMAGDKFDIYAKLFDSYGNWEPIKQEYAYRVSWSVSTNETVLTPDAGNRTHSVFRAETAGSVYTIGATYSDGTMRVGKQMTIKVVPNVPFYIEAVTDSNNIDVGRTFNTAHLDSNKTFTFRKDFDEAIFYAVLRDAYGNFIGMADGSVWSDNTNRESITADPIGDASSARVSRHGTVFGDSLYVIVIKDIYGDTLSDSVRIIVRGESISAVGPNPFVPGYSPIMSRLESIASGRFAEQLELYGKIAANSKSGGGNGNAYNANGVLVTATAPRPVKTSGGTNGVMYVTDAKAIIYDAVGHIVFRSKPGDIVSPDANTFGFVWDGRSLKGKTVGWGTYAMQITATMINGEKFTVMRMIGVKCEKDTPCRQPQR